MPRDRTHLERGRKAEEFAAHYLDGRGLRFVAANYRTRCGEIDLVMQDGLRLVIVEVRSRQRRVPISPEETVDRGKRMRLIRATRCFLQYMPQYAEWPVRFDIFGVTGCPGEEQVVWIRNAFTLDDVAGY